MSLTEPAFCNHFFHILQNFPDIPSCRRSNFLNITKFPVSQNGYILAKPSHSSYHIYSYISHHCKRYESNRKNPNDQTTDYIKRCEHTSDQSDDKKNDRSYSKHSSCRCQKSSTDLYRSPFEISWAHRYRTILTIISHFRHLRSLIRTISLIFCTRPASGILCISI